LISRVYLSAPRLKDRREKTEVKLRKPSNSESQIWNPKLRTITLEDEPDDEERYD
jgi:hypothetical protein